MEKQQGDDPQRKKQQKMPAAGPHDKPHLTDESKTPGAGTLPEPGTNEDSTSG